MRLTEVMVQYCGYLPVLKQARLVEDLTELSQLLTCDSVIKLRLRLLGRFRLRLLLWFLGLAELFP